MATLNEFLDKALADVNLDEGKAYSKVASLIDTYHKKAEKMEIDLHKKIKSIVVKTDDPDELGKIAGAVGEVSEPGTYVSWKELEKSIGSIDEAESGYSADVEFKIKITGVKNMKEGMKRAQRFVDDVTKKFKLFDPRGGVIGLDGPPEKAGKKKEYGTGARGEFWK